MRPRHEVADIIHLHGRQYERQYRPVVQVKKTLSALTLCRTEVLGGHISKCSNCGKQTISYNSCRNRHCPKCQAVNKERWIMAREKELLAVPYYHMVFTLPHHFNSLLPAHQKEIYGCLFAASWQTIRTFALDDKYLGAKSGMIAVLHTWGQQLWLHPHLHCIVPAGGITNAGKWKMARYKDKYLFPKRALSLVFRARFMAELRKKMPIPQHIAGQVFKTKWVVYAKRPFVSPKTVVEYLGRYTHKIAISNHRLVDVNSKTVSFNYKDYRDRDKAKQITLSGTEFLRRFCSHILPSGFVRIRHYGFLASRNKKVELNIAKKAFNQAPWQQVNYSWAQIAKEKLKINVDQCVACKQQTMAIIKIIEPDRGPPINNLSYA